MEPPNLTSQGWGAFLYYILCRSRAHLAWLNALRIKSAYPLRLWGADTFAQNFTKITPQADVWLGIAVLKITIGYPRSPSMPNSEVIVSRRDVPAQLRESTRLPVRVAVLGGGAVTSELYLAAIELVRDVKLVAVVDPSANAETRLREAGYEGLVVRTSFHDFLRDRERHAVLELDGVVVALPHSLHEAAVVATLDVGLHVLCEKPLALDVAACTRMAAAAQRSTARAAVAMVRRLPASVVALRKALAAGLIGTVREVDIEDGSYFAWPAASAAPFQPVNGGVIGDLGAHYLDLLHELFGPLTPVSYVDDWQGGCEATAEYRLIGRQGAPIRLMLSRERKLRNTTIISGERGRLEMQKDNFATCRWLPSPDFGVVADLRPEHPFIDASWPPTFETSFAQQFWEFAQVIRGEQPARVSIAEATESVRLIEWAYKARRHHQPTRATPQTAERIRANQPVGDGSAVVVTGGTGFIGGRLVERLVRDGAPRVIVPVRGYRSVVRIATMPVDMPVTNLLDMASVRSVVKGARSVFHLAYGRDGDDGVRVTVEGTKNVVNASIEAGVESVVVLSTVDVFGRSDAPEILDENASYRPFGGAYGESKAIMERWCLERAATSPDTRIVVLNPGNVYGIGGKTFTVMPIAMARAGSFCWVDGGRGIANHCFVDNLVDAIILAARVAKAHAQRFIITDGACSWRELLEPFLGSLAASVPSYTRAQLTAMAVAEPRAGLMDLARAVARSPELVRTVKQLPMVGGLADWVVKKRPGVRDVLRPKRTVTADVVFSPPPVWLADLFGIAQTKYSAARARTALAWEPRVDLATAQDRTIEWLRHSGVLPV